MYSRYKLPGLSLRAAAVVVEIAEQHFCDWQRPSGRPKKLSLLAALRLTLCRLRRNATYNDLGEDFDLADSTAWEYHQLIVVFLAEVFGVTDDELPELLSGKVCLIDGSLIPTFDWRHLSQLFSNKHKKAGVNVLIIGDLHGRLVGVSKAFPGAWHDKHCLDETNWETHLADVLDWIGDSGFQGTTAIHPVKKAQGQAHDEVRQVDKIFNNTVSRLRVANEWVIAHLKNWRILTTRYRSDLTRIDTDIQATIGLQKLNEQFSETPLTWNRVKNLVSE